ncbi:MAG: serine--tRNA ligase [Betaproteobacteria bacterium TMED156]|nr:MAG: serine--tRNA ligase [Betaproteobacteria bacterium TMED156]
MIDIQLIRRNPEFVIESLKKRGVNFDIKQFKYLEELRKTLQIKSESLQNKKNLIAKQIGQAKAKGEPAESLLTEASMIPKKFEKINKELSQIQQKIKEWLVTLPNLPDEEVPIGKSEEFNKVVRKYGKIPEFKFTPKDHTEVGAGLGLDFDSASSLSGSRFAFLKGPLARLHRALVQFMLDFQTKKNHYLECYTPYIVNEKTLYGTGQLPKFEDDLFSVKKGGFDAGGETLYLIPTSEVSLTNLAADKIFSESDLPIRYTAHTPCFRSEAGSYGQDTKGLIRQHQFDKVEMVQIVLPNDSNQVLEQMVSNAEDILRSLNLSYRVMLLCSGDMGFSACKTFDIEVWLPAQNTYREISSCSNCSDFQARRMQARVKKIDANGKTRNEFVHTLNGSGLAVGRTLVAILENFQTENGTVLIPEALQKYMNNETEINPLVK